MNQFEEFILKTTQSREDPYKSMYQEMMETSKNSDMNIKSNNTSCSDVRYYSSTQENTQYKKGDITTPAPSLSNTNGAKKIAENSNQIPINFMMQCQTTETENHFLRSLIEKQGAKNEYTIRYANMGLCIHPKGVPIEVGIIQITNVIGYKIINTNNIKNIIVVNYIDSNYMKRTTTVNEKNLTAKNLVGCFPGFAYVCSNVKLANGFLAWYLNTIFKGDYSKVIPYYAGFSLSTENNIDRASFFCNNDSMPTELLEICSENIRQNALPVSCKTVKELTDYAVKFLNTPEKCLLFIISLCGTFSSILDEIGCSVKQIFAISSPNSDATRQASIYLKTFNRGQTPISFDTNKAQINNILQNTKDEVVVINDCSIVNNAKRRTAMLQYVLELNNSSETQPHCTAIISDFVPSLIEDNKKICVRLSDNFYTEMTQEEEREMCVALNCITYYFIDLICKKYEGTKEYIKHVFNTEFNNVREGIQNIHSKTSFAAICSIASLVSSNLNLNFVYENVFDIINEILENTSVTIGSCYDVIANEFLSCLIDAVRSGEISVMLLSKDMNFIKGNSLAIIKNDLIMIEDCTIRDKILPQMRTADSVYAIIKALDTVRLLHTTKGKRYRQTVYESGDSVFIDFIALKIEDIPDSKIITSIIKENKCKEWFSAEAPNDNLFPVITNRLGEKAYQRFESEKSDNMHCFYLGQSGSGKTNSLTERMCSLFKVGQKVIVFDTSDSFTRDAIINNLTVGGDESAYEKAVKFVDDNITFHKVEEHGVPVDILNLKYPAHPETKRKIIYSIVSAHIPKMRDSQKAKIRNGITDLIENGKLNIIDMHERLTDSAVSGSLAMQFKDMLSCFLEYKVSEKSWEEFLNESKGIVVISTDAISGSGGSGLVDMLLMSLFYNQHNNTSQHLALFIDEIQNQNFNPDGAITQILKEGRKNHISLNYATQFLPSRNDDKKKVMNLASLQVFLQPDDISAKSISRTIKVPANKLTAMNQGECYVSGTLYNHEKNSFEKGIIHGFTYRNFVPFEVKN